MRYCLLTIDKMVKSILLSLSKSEIYNLYVISVAPLRNSELEESWKSRNLMHAYTHVHFLIRDFIKLSDTHLTQERLRRIDSLLHLAVNVWHFHQRYGERKKAFFVLSVLLVLELEWPYSLIYLNSPYLHLLHFP